MRVGVMKGVWVIVGVNVRVGDSDGVRVGYSVGVVFVGKSVLVAVIVAVKVGIWRAVSPTLSTTRPRQ